MTGGEEADYVDISGETQNSGAEPEINTAGRQQHQDIDSRDASNEDLPTSYQDFMSEYDRVVKEDKSTLLGLEPIVVRINELSKKLPKGGTVSPAELSVAFEYLDEEARYRKVTTLRNTSIRNGIREWETRLASLSEVCLGEEEEGEKLARARLEECVRNTIHGWMKGVLEHEGDK